MAGTDHENIEHDKRLDDWPLGNSSQPTVSRETLICRDRKATEKRRPAHPPIPLGRSVGRRRTREREGSRLRTMSLALGAARHRDFGDVGRLPAIQRDSALGGQQLSRQPAASSTSLRCPRRSTDETGKEPSGASGRAPLRTALSVDPSVGPGRAEPRPAPPSTTTYRRPRSACVHDRLRCARPLGYPAGPRCRSADGHAANRQRDLDMIPRRPRNFRNDRPLLPGYSIDKAGLSRVGGPATTTRTPSLSGSTRGRSSHVGTRHASRGAVPR